MEISDICSEEEFIEKTKTIKKWVNHQSVPTKLLEEELLAWYLYVRIDQC